MQFTDQVQSVTREKVIPKVYDITLTGNVGALIFFGNAKPWSSGFRMDVPLKFAKSTEGGVVGIADVLSTERQTNRVKMQFQPRAITKPVVIADFEESLNQGDERVLDLIATETESMSHDLADDFADEFFTGTGSGDRWDSVDNAADDATNYATYGTLARATYAGLNGYYAASIGALALADFSAAYNDVQVGAEKPSHIITTPAVWTAYEGLLQPTVRAGYQINGYPQVTRTGVVPSQQALRGDIGFSAIWYRGTPVISDEKCTTQRAYFVNDRNFAFYGIKLRGYETVSFKTSNVDSPGLNEVPNGLGFNWTGFRKPTNQLAQVGHLVLGGNFISTNPRLTGQLRGITG